MKKKQKKQQQHITPDKVFFFLAVFLFIHENVC